MKKRLFKFLILYLFSTISFELYSQESINTCGDDILSVNGGINYTIGQLFFNTNTTGSLAEGIQHPIETYVVSSYLDIYKSISLLTIYPNPTCDILNLKVNQSLINENNHLSYQLIDIYGKIVLEDAINKCQTTIKVNNLISGSYLFRVGSGLKVLTSSKIIKK